MPPNLTSGTFTISSLIEGQPPVSVDDTKPGSQSIHLNGSVAPWVVKAEGQNKYRLRLGDYPFTGVIDSKVTVSVDPAENLEWIALYRASQDAYTITPVDNKAFVWTITDPSDVQSQIVVEKAQILYVATGPICLTTQLFRFTEV
ncbi:hypothetical protein OG21DRAFT_1510690 [Imleria badia]|nr:hypothetical protein OG21DRAFT_1510690 [Imleria badia]